MMMSSYVSSFVFIEFLLSGNHCRQFNPICNVSELFSNFHAIIIKSELDIVSDSK